MFHTFSDQTKVKRKSNFDDFLKIALQIYPMPLCLEDFLDIIDRCGRSYSHITLSDTAATSDRPLLPHTYTSPAKGGRAHSHSHNKHRQTTSNPNEQDPDQSSIDDSQKNALNDILNHKDDNQKMTSVLYSTFIITTLLYIAFILLGVIDIEGSNYGKAGTKDE